MPSWWTNPILRLILLGTYDDKSPLAHLRGNEFILRVIFERLLDGWKSHIENDQVGYVRLGWIRRYVDDVVDIPTHEPRIVSIPAPLTADGEFVPLNINMMPIKMGDVNSLPDNCKRYQQLISDCLICGRNREKGKIGYLTIHEGYVEANTSQRRSGLHVEVSGVHGKFEREVDSYWGRGFIIDNEMHGGIFMASTVANSCGLWNVVAEDPTQVMGLHGDMEHMRTLLDADKHGYMTPEANELIWMTDSTLHESLPLPTRQFRQYFRLVTSQVSHWFADHSTPNPLGIRPRCHIVHGNKFEVLKDEYDITKSPITQCTLEDEVELMDIFD